MSKVTEGDFLLPFVPLQDFVTVSSAPTHLLIINVIKYVCVCFPLPGRYNLVSVISERLSALEASTDQHRTRSPLLMAAVLV